MDFRDTVKIRTPEEAIDWATELDDALFEGKRNGRIKTADQAWIVAEELDKWCAIAYKEGD